MNLKATAAATLAVAMAALLPGSALGENVVENVGVAAAGGDDWVTNEFDLDIGGGVLNGLQVGGTNGWDAAHAVSNCQLLLAVNSIIINFVAVEGLGLISDEDLTAIEGFPFLLRASNTIDQQQTVVVSTNGTSSCEQRIGPIWVVHAQSDGWGEAAPMVAQADAMADSLQIIPEPGIGAGGDNVIVNVGVAAGDLANILTNDVDIDMFGGSGNAVSSCQILIGWNTLAVNVASVEQSGAIADDDVTDINFTLPDRAGPIAEASLLGEDTIIDHETVLVHEGGTSSCFQQIESVRLIVGNPEDIGPES